MEWLSLVPFAVVLLPMSWLFARQTKMAERIDDTYTKEETEHIIDLKSKPIEVAIEHNTEVNQQLVIAINELRSELARIERSSKD